MASACRIAFHLRKDNIQLITRDFMTWNVTKDEIVTRMAVTEEATWAPPSFRQAMPPSQDDVANFKEKRGLTEVGFSDFTKSGFRNVDDVLKPIYEQASEKVGREFPYPEK